MLFDGLIHRHVQPENIAERLLRMTLASPVCPSVSREVQQYYPRTDNEGGTISVRLRHPSGVAIITEVLLCRFFV